MTKPKNDGKDEMLMESQIETIEELVSAHNMTEEEIYNRMELLQVGRKTALKIWLIIFIHLPTSAILPFFKDIFMAFYDVWFTFWGCLRSLWMALHGQAIGFKTDKLEKKVAPD